MNDEVKKVEAVVDADAKKVESEAVTLWHEVEAFFAKLKARVEGDENKTQVLNTFQVATHEVVGTEAPAAEEKGAEEVGNGTTQNSGTTDQSATSTASAEGTDAKATA